MQTQLVLGLCVVCASFTLVTSRCRILFHHARGRIQGLDCLKKSLHPNDMSIIDKCIQSNGFADIEMFVEHACLTKQEKDNELQDCFLREYKKYANTDDEEEIKARLARDLREADERYEKCLETIDLPDIDYDIPDISLEDLSL